VGAGVSGLACARTLRDCGADFIVLSENIGGRIHQSADGATPLGAFYVRADYDHVNRFATRGRRIRSRDTLRHDRTGAYTRWDRRLLTHPLQFARFAVLLIRFRRHYRRFKSRAVTVAQSEAIRSDPFLDRLYHQPASETIDQHGISDLAQAYIGPGLHGSAFVPLDRLTGFTMLLGSLPAIEPIYEFTMRWDDFLGGFRDNITMAKVATIAETDHGYRVDAVDGRAWMADTVVVATNPAEAQRLVGLDRINEPVTAHVFEIDGELRTSWRQARLHLFGDDEPTLAILQQPQGPTLLCSQEPEPRFDHYFTQWNVLEHHWWEPAFNLVGDTLVDCEQEPNLYVIGDHNVCGLEDAFITGVFAANRIIHSRRT